MSSTILMKPFPNKFSDTTILLIAGTSSIGMGVANLLLTRGAAKIILTSTRQTKLDLCIATLQSTHPHLPSDAIRGYVLDLASPSIEDNIKAMFAAMQEDGIDMVNHLVYLAGDPLPMVRLEDITLEVWTKASQVRTISGILVVKHAVPFLKKASNLNAYGRPSSITFTSGSISSKPIPGGWIMLSAMAGGRASLSRQLAFELGPNIRVNCVSPGIVDTKLWNGMDEKTKNDFLKSHASKVPTGRVAIVGDVAEGFAYVMADGNITGEEIRTDSGIRLI